MNHGGDADWVMQLGWLWVGVVMWGCAWAPAGLVFWNLFLYRKVLRGRVGPVRGAISVLIPARNESGRIGAALDSVLGAADATLELEVLVLDDGSTDGTGDVVLGRASRDPRIRLLRGEGLPEGWNGKQHACHLLGQAAANPWLLFLDADVRLEPGALGRMLAHAESGPEGIGLWSGVPRQVLKGPLEKLLLPLIHFVLLGFLPMAVMRRSLGPAFGAGCGQLFLARASAYRRAGGHAAVKATRHDGLKLPRAFRHAGIGTDLFDATDLASCRMYGSAGEVVGGLAKNATEGLGASGVLVPMTFVLLAGQVLPWILLLMSSDRRWVWSAGVCVAVGLLVRVVLTRRFQQSWVGALLHPVGVLVLLGIQWWARGLESLGYGVEWKGRGPVGRSGAVPWVGG